MTGISMQVSKWGNSLAVRLPAAIVEALCLKEGDEVDIRLTSPGEFYLARPMTREQAIESLRAMRWSFPPDFQFDREEANER
jgi:antitoxin MazE